MNTFEIGVPAMIDVWSELNDKYKDDQIRIVKNMKRSMYICLHHI